MAIYHFHAQYISRGKGRSIVAASAYRSGEKIQNQYDGIKHDYTNKSDVVHKQIIGPEHAPEWVTNRSKLWNEVEKIEKAKNASLAKEINIALPAELKKEQQIQLIVEYTQENFVNKGMVADIVIHDKGDGNPHAHILLTNRPFNEQGEWGQKAYKEYILDKQGEKIKLPSGEYKSKRVDFTDWNSKKALEQWRENWSKTTNKYLELIGSKQRIDHRSYQEQGIEKIPSIHLGVTAHQMEQKGIRTDRGDINRQVIEDNQKITILQKYKEKSLRRKQQQELLIKELQSLEKIEHKKDSVQIKLEKQQPQAAQENKLQKKSFATEPAKEQLVNDIKLSIKQLKEQDDKLSNELTELQQLKTYIGDKYLDKACNIYLDKKYKQQEDLLKEKLQKYQKNVEKYNKKNIFSQITTDIFSDTGSKLRKEYEELIKTKENLEYKKDNEKRELKSNSYSQESKKIKEDSYTLAKQDKPENQLALEKIEKKTRMFLDQRLAIADKIKYLQKELPKEVKKEIKLEKNKKKDMDFSL